jgi:hypothetical protein
MKNILKLPVPPFPSFIVSAHKHGYSSELSIYLNKKTFWKQMIKQVKEEDKQKGFKGKR